MKFKGLVLDPFQEDAVAAMNRNESVMVSAPTGSGKTLIADYVIDRDLREGKRVVYTAPIKALSNQKYKDFCEQYGPENIGLVTGDTVENPRAPVLIMTTEIYRNMAVLQDPIIDEVSFCVMDEIHFINDPERGYVWEESIIFSPDSVRFVFLSATIPNAEEFAEWVEGIKKHPVVVVRHDVRPVPLDVQFYDEDMGITTLKQIEARKNAEAGSSYNSGRYGKGRGGKGKRSRGPMVKKPDFSRLVRLVAAKQKLPCIYFVFSRKKTQEYAEKAAKHNYLSSEEQKEVIAIVNKHFTHLSVNMRTLPSIQLLKKCLRHGIGFHHAGLLPDGKTIVEELFAKGLVKILFATETFAVGINMPAKSVCLDGLRKYTGEGFRYLTSKEFFQMSGRAGRRGLDKQGLAISVIHRPAVNIRKVDDLTSKDTLPIMSQFRLTYNTVLNMINLHNEGEIEIILRNNFYTYQETKSNERTIADVKRRYNNIVKFLTEHEYVQDGALTQLGMFTTHIYSNEIEISQLFHDPFLELDPYRILLLLGALVFEPRFGLEFYHTYPSKETKTMRKFLQRHEVLKGSEWIEYIDSMTALIKPCIETRDFTAVLNNTSMGEGDIIRFFSQLADKLEQLDRASQSDDFRLHVQNAKSIIREMLEEVM